jgi:hypothetical protein
MPAWREVQLLVARELGERVCDAEPLTPVRLSRMTWAARAGGTGAIVVKVREGDEGRDFTSYVANVLPGDRRARLSHLRMALIWQVPRGYIVRGSLRHPRQTPAGLMRCRTRVRR